MLKVLKFVFVFSLLGTSACTITHNVDQDYVQYLANNKGEVTFPKISKSGKYFLDEATKNHRVEFRAGTAGYANLWVVRIGRMLEATLEQGDIRLSFDDLTETKSIEGNQGLLITFHLDNYRFAGFQAHVGVDVSVYSDESKILSKTYRGIGISQGGKVFWAGVFGMKNAIQQSTKNAIDQIFTELIADLKDSAAKPLRTSSASCCSAFPPPKE